MNELTQSEINQGFFIKAGEKTTKGIEQICKEAALASRSALFNQFY